MFSDKKSSNPVFKGNFGGQVAGSETDHCQMKSILHKIYLSVFIVMFSAAMTWMHYSDAFFGETVNLTPKMTTEILASSVGGFALGLFIIFTRKANFITVSIYSVLQGYAMALVTMYFETKYPGIAFQALGLTLAITLSMLFCYQTRLIKVTEKFKSGLLICMIGILLIYIVSLILPFFGMQIPMIHESGPVGIAFSLFVCAIASLNLLIDFSSIEEAVENRYSAKLEWYLAFGLLITLIWLYVEVLDLIRKIRK